MYRKKIAFYVEGQTEQVFLNHLILTWWAHSGIHVENIRLLAGQKNVCPVPNFLPETEAKTDIFINPKLVPAVANSNLVTQKPGTMGTIKQATVTMPKPTNMARLYPIRTI